MEETPEHLHEVEVLVLGAGPAGVSVAISLQKLGRKVLVLSEPKGKQNSRLETLSRETVKMISDFGISLSGEENAFLPNRGSITLWQTDLPILEKAGSALNEEGWLVDKGKFSELLTGELNHRKIPHLVADAVKGWEKKPEIWQTSAEVNGGSQVTISSKWVVDCTGRRAAFCRELKIKRIYEDHLIGFSNWFSKSSSEHDQLDPSGINMVESVSEGWWFATQLNDRQRLTLFFTDKGNQVIEKARNPKGFSELLNNSKMVSASLESYKPELENGKITGFAAGSSRLEYFHGENWAAAGDAAMSFDPLSSQGITNALFSGKMVANAIHQHLSGEKSSFSDLDEKMEVIWSNYLIRLKHFYFSVKKFPHSQFWNQRQGKKENP